jgi:hypothetical protein
MFGKKEILSIAIIALVLSVAISLSDLSALPPILLIVSLVILINVLAKKISAFYLESEIEFKIWEFQRFGFRPSEYLRRPFAAGAFFPLISKILLFPFQHFVWMASLIFDVKPSVTRAARKHGLYTFSEMTEDHIGLIAASGIAANILFAILGYLIGFPIFAKINLYYAFFNMLPISNLDGNKIFFGNNLLWSILATIVFIGLVLIILTV